MTDLMKIPYPDFVRGLFTKPGDSPGRIAHAAVGLVGEAIELRAASDRHNMKEELGDWAFYAVALWNELGQPMVPGRVIAFPSTIPTALDVLMVHSNEILDLAKKSWIYEKEMDRAQLILHLGTAGYAQSQLVQLLGFHEREIELHNREKLILRYPGGTYSAAAAQARADKAQPMTTALADKDL